MDCSFDDSKVARKFPRKIGSRPLASHADATYTFVAEAKVWMAHHEESAIADAQLTCFVSRQLMSNDSLSD
jgi:hypothetical protein